MAPRTFQQQTRKTFGPLPPSEYVHGRSLGGNKGGGCFGSCCERRSAGGAHGPLTLFIPCLLCSQEPAVKPPQGGAASAIQGSGPPEKSTMYRDDYRPRTATRVRRRDGSRRTRSLVTFLLQPLDARTANLTAYFPCPLWLSSFPSLSDRPASPTHRRSCLAAAARWRRNLWRRTPMFPTRARRQSLSSPPKPSESIFITLAALSFVVLQCARAAALCAAHPPTGSLRG